MLPERVATIADRLGMRYGRVTIRASRSKWASCSARNDLSLSLFMMLLPEHLRDFVIVHELCHTVHKNHSREFHALVDSPVGGREKLTRERCADIRPTTCNPAGRRRTTYFLSGSDCTHRLVGLCTRQTGRTRRRQQNSFSLGETEGADGYIYLVRI